MSTDRDFGLPQSNAQVQTRGTINRIQEMAQKQARKDALTPTERIVISATVRQRMNEKALAKGTLPDEALVKQAIANAIAGAEDVNMISTVKPK